MKRKLKGDLFCPFTTFSLWERGQVHSDLCVGNIGWNAWLMCVPSFARARFLSEMICSENFAKASVQLMEYVAGLLTTFDLGVTFILFPQPTVEKGEIILLSKTDILSKELFPGGESRLLEVCPGSFVQKGQHVGSKA